jgi:hypothetical protein
MTAEPKPEYETVNVCPDCKIWFVLEITECPKCRRNGLIKAKRPKDQYYEWYRPEVTP